MISDISFSFGKSDSRFIPKYSNIYDELLKKYSPEEIKLTELFFKNEKFPSKFKIFVWDKIFTPFSVLIDFITNYKIGKCIVTVYKK